MNIQRIVVALAAALGATALADTATLTAVRDNTLYETGSTEEEQTSNGAGSFFFAGQTGPNASNVLRRGLVRFDLSSIPANAAITSATLTLRCSKSVSSGLPMDVHRVLADWGEGGSDAGVSEGAGGIPTVNDATWFWRFFGTADVWTNPGGDFTPGISATQTVAGVAFYSWSSPQLAADVAGWVASPASNFGWVLRGAEATSQSAKRFDSRTNATVANRPSLVVNFTVPQPTMACCMNDGSCTDLTSANCATAGGFQGGSTCSPNPCALACCFGNGSCLQLSVNACNAMTGGTPGAPQSTCTPNTCPVVNGVCCFGAACLANQAPASCTGPQKLFVTSTLVCNVPGEYKTPCCKADFNKVGGITVQDLFDYLGAWFGKLQSADINGAPPAAGPGVTVQDLFDFLGAWFAKGARRTTGIERCANARSARLAQRESEGVAGTNARSTLDPVCSGR